MPTIAAVISFCSNDWRFLRACVEGVAPFCQQIFITVCDHFFDGSPENYGLLEEAFRRFSMCTFLVFKFDSSQSYRAFSPLYPGHPDWRHEWHNTGRYISYFFAKTDFLFFLDADEIVDRLGFSNWLKVTDLEKFSALRFSGFTHFREAKFEALMPEDCSLLVKKTVLKPEFLWDEDERIGLFHRLSGEKQLGVMGLDSQPMFRHYSGVRTREEFLKKFESWGHHWERDWKQIIEEEFSRDFSGVDCVRGHRYREIAPHFDPLLEEIPRLSQTDLKGLHRFPNVIIVSQKEMFNQQLAHDFALDCHDH